MNRFTTCAEAVTAVLRHFISDASSNGLLRKPTAPLSSARVRFLSSGKAVIRMTGVWYPSDRNASCNSRPLNPGICRSVIRHAVSATILDLRKASADAKVVVLYPKDSTSSRMPSRANASSSTIEINGALDIPVPKEGLSDQDGYRIPNHIQNI